MSKILVTGANGFLGSELLKFFSDCSRPSVAAYRKSLAGHAGEGVCSVGDIDGNTQWRCALGECNVVIHTAARTHVMREYAVSPLAEFRKINVDGTLNLARQAAEAGIKRFIFISSIKVNGESSGLGNAFKETDQPTPEDDYGLSKLEAEQGLITLAKATGMEVVIIRPPLIYGPGVKGNFASMIRLVKRGFPLPFGSVQNCRSLISLGNLVDLIHTCVDHPAAANQIFVAGDGEDLSTTELLNRIAREMGVASRLLPVPTSFLKFCAVLIGRKAMAQRLLGSLQVDITKARVLLGWEPKMTVDQGLAECLSATPLKAAGTRIKE